MNGEFTATAEILTKSGIRSPGLPAHSNVQSSILTKRMHITWSHL